MRIIISEHAEEKFKERWKLGGNSKEVAEEAFKNGKHLSNSLLKTTVLLGYHLDNYWSATYKVYRKFIFVFKCDGSESVLLTLFPRKYLERRRIEMLNRHKRKNCYKNFKPSKK